MWAHFVEDPGGLPLYENNPKHAFVNASVKFECFKSLSLIGKVLYTLQTEFIFKWFQLVKVCLYFVSAPEIIDKMSSVRFDPKAEGNGVNG